MITITFLIFSLFGIIAIIIFNRIINRKLQRRRDELDNIFNDIMRRNINRIDFEELLKDYKKSDKNKDKLTKKQSEEIDDWIDDIEEDVE